MKSAVGSGYYLIRLKKGVVYLAVILDAFSRKVVGWALGPDTREPVGRLRRWNRPLSNDSHDQVCASFRPWRAVRFRDYVKDLRKKTR